MPRIRYSEAVRQRAIHLWLKGAKSNSKSGHSDAIPQEEAATFIPVNMIDQKPVTVEIVTPSGFTIRLNDCHS